VNAGAGGARGKPKPDRSPGEDWKREHGRTIAKCCPGGTDS